MPEERLQDAEDDVTITLTDVETDIRSPTRLFQLCITNKSKYPILLHTITHGYSEKASLTTYTHDVFHIRRENKHAQLKRHIAYLIDYICCCMGYAKPNTTPPAFVFSLIRATLFIKHYVLRTPRLFATPCSTIMDGESATGSLEFYKKQENYSIIHEHLKLTTAIIEHEIEELKHIEAQLKPRLAINDIIYKNDSYTKTISAKYKRGLLNSRQELLEVTCYYMTLDQETMELYRSDRINIINNSFNGEILSSQRAEACSIISPWPIVLSSVAMAFGVIGLSLKTNSIAAILSPLTATNNSIPLLSIFLALIFFNVYEYTSYKTKLTFRLNWRSAMVIGTLCGLGGDKILKVLEAIIQ